MPVTTQTAAASGRVDIIEKMVQFATDPNPSDEYGATPLHAAAWTGTLVPVLLPEFRAGSSVQSSNLSLGEYQTRIQPPGME